MSETKPSNLVVFAFIVVAIVVVWFAWFSMHHDRSADQRILIERSKH